MIVFVVSVIIAALRILGLKHIAYQAVAHLWIGGLIVAGYKNRGVSRWYDYGIVVALCVVEGVSAFYGTYKILN